MILGDLQPEYISTTKWISPPIEDEVCLIWRFPNEYGVMISKVDASDILEACVTYWINTSDKTGHSPYIAQDWRPVTSDALIALLVEVREYGHR